MLTIEHKNFKTRFFCCFCLVLQGKSWKFASTYYHTPRRMHPRVPWGTSFPSKKTQFSLGSLKSLWRVPQATSPSFDVPSSLPSEPTSPAELLRSQQGKKRAIHKAKSSCLLYFSMQKGLHLEMFGVTRASGLDTTSLLKTDQFCSAHTVMLRHPSREIQSHAVSRDVYKFKGHGNLGWKCHNICSRVIHILINWGF